MGLNASSGYTWMNTVSGGEICMSMGVVLWVNLIESPLCLYLRFCAFFCNILFFPRFLLLFFFSSRITYHGPGMGRIKIPLGMDDPLGQ